VTEYCIVREDNKFHGPLLNPPEGGERVPNSRPSTLSKGLDSQEFLIPWELATVAMGLARRRYLLARLFGAAPAERTLVPGDGAEISATRFADWLARKSVRRVLVAQTDPTSSHERTTARK